jgi:putative nucleotidyltransferase with HDIG domain
MVAATPEITPLKMKNIAILAQVASMSLSNDCLNAEIDTMRVKLECMDKGFGSAASELDRSVQDMVYALTIPMEMRDPYTSGHQIRVTNLAVAIAEEMGVAQYHIDGLRLAASIHDIGKIVIPFEILNRPMRLMEAELNLIKMHPQVGFEMLGPISFRWPIAEIVRQHHERADGSGYPRGLKSGETLLEAKILAVADVVEAMSSHRPYRASLGIDAALDEVSSQSGIIYDTEAVAACIRLLLIKNFSFEGTSPVTIQNARPLNSVNGRTK